MRRRAFLLHAAAGATTTALAAAAPGEPAEATGLIDTNVYLSHWPTQHSWAATPARLVEKLRRHGVVSAWTGSYDPVLDTDVGGANARLADACGRDGGGILRPFGTVNPLFPDWEEDIRRCHEVHRMAGIRLFPNYHRYTLDDARVTRLLDVAARRGLLVQIALALEDDRSQSPALQAPPVTAAPLVEAMVKVPSARVMLLNSFSRAIGANHVLLRKLAAAGVGFELATLEGAAGIEAMLHAVPGIRLTFGSYSPYYYFEAALLKLQESALSVPELAVVSSGHARAILTNSTGPAPAPPAQPAGNPAAKSRSRS